MTQSNNAFDAQTPTYTPPPIQGYRVLSQQEVDLVNDIKETGKLMQTIHAAVMAYLVEQSQRAPMIPFGENGIPTEGDIDPAKAERLRINAAEPGRWAALSKTHFQEGLMCLSRAVMQPTGFA